MQRPSGFSRGSLEMYDESNISAVRDAFTLQPSVDGAATHQLETTYFIFLAALQ
jgi:hypothetical protein